MSMWGHSNHLGSVCARGDRTSHKGLKGLGDRLLTKLRGEHSESLITREGGGRLISEGSLSAIVSIMERALSCETGLYE